MATISTELNFIVFLASLITIFGVINYYMPVAYQIFSNFDLLWLGGSFFTVAGACVVAPALTGAIACPLVILIAGIGTIINYFGLSILGITSTTTMTIIKSIIIIPLVIGYLYVISKLARGGG